MYESTPSITSPAIWSPSILTAAAPSWGRIDATYSSGVVNVLLAVAFAHNTSPDASTLAHEMSPLKATELAEMSFATVKLSLQLIGPSKFELALTSREPETVALWATLKVLAERELLHDTAPPSAEVPITNNVPPDDTFPRTWAFWVTLRLLADTLLAHVTAPSSREVLDA